MDVITQWLMLVYLLVCVREKLRPDLAEICRIENI